MSEILPRALLASVTNALKLFPVVVLTGARQTGKSTLASGGGAVVEGYLKAR